MKIKKEFIFALQELRIDNIRKQKRGLHFIMASVFIWIAVLMIHLSIADHYKKLIYFLLFNSIDFTGVFTFIDFKDRFSE